MILILEGEGEGESTDAALPHRPAPEIGITRAGDRPHYPIARVRASSLMTTFRRVPDRGGGRKRSRASGEGDAAATEIHDVGSKRRAAPRAGDG